MELQLITIGAVLILGGVMFSFIKNIFNKTLHKACVKGDIEAVKQFLGDGVDVNAKDDGYRTPLHFAAHSGHTETAKFLIGSGADVDAKDSRRWTPLHEATDWRHEEIVELLIAAGADVNAQTDDGLTPLGHAERHPEIADLLRKHGGKTGEELAKQEPPTAKAPDISIHDAALIGNIEAVKQHLAAGTDVNTKGDNGETPLHEATGAGHKEVVELLIAEGADVNAKDGIGGKTTARMGEIKDQYLV